MSITSETRREAYHEVLKTLPAKEREVLLALKTQQRRGKREDF